MALHQHRYKSEREAKRKAAALRRKGKDARVRRDPLTGDFIVLVVGTLLALSVLSTIRRM